MRLLRNTLSLYLTLFGGLILNFVQLKILSSALTQIDLGKFFTISAFGQIASGILLLGIPLVLTRYLPKFQAKNEERKMISLVRLIVSCCLLLSLIVYVFLFFFGYQLGMFVYKDEIIGKYLSFGFLVFFIVSFFSIIFTVFIGLRKMHYSALLNLLYLSLLTFLLFYFREYLSIILILKIYLVSVIPSILIGGFLLYKVSRNPAHKLCAGRNLETLKPRNLIQEIMPYWKYAIWVGFLAPLFFYLDRLIIGYFLTMNFVALFTIASKVSLWGRRILDIPMQAVSPEMSYSWEKERKEILGKDLGLTIKLLFLLSLVITSLILVGGKEIILLLTSNKYLDALVPLFLLAISIPIDSAYTPIEIAMRATGKIWFYLSSNIIWIVSYVILTLLLISRFKLVGVGIAYLLATIITLIFNIEYVAKRHTSLKITPNFFYKTVGFAIIFGVFTYFIFSYFHLPIKSELSLYLLVTKFLLLVLFICVGYLLFLLKGKIFSLDEREQLRTIFTSRYGFLRNILT
ncbi:oligosaccharide flippase family protein [candidate division WOR-3 bacterium]|nr:oligosaccharide flippase family protein [candidate division WOR-3 bacterium]